MTEEHVPAQVTREEAKHYILLTLDRFRVMTLHLADNKSRLPSALNGNEGGLDLLYELEARDFYRNLMFLYTSDIFEVLSSEGLRELLLKCKELSDRFCLKVRIAEDIRVVEEDVIERFTSELILSQAVNEDGGKEDKNKLKTILITLQKEIDDDSGRKQSPFEGGEQCQPLSRDEMIEKIEGATIRIYSHLRNLQEEHRNDVSKATDEILRLTKHTERVAEALEWMRHSKELENMDDDGLTALLVLCLENLHLLRKGRVSKKCTHSYDGAIDVAKYIVEEIKKNIKSTEALEIHDYMHYEKYLEKNYNFNGFAPPPDPLIIKAIGLAKWIEMVDTGHPWDHKPKISSLFRYCSVERFTRKGNLSKSHFHKYKNFDYFYDIWSNIHYGYVGRFCGISEQFLLLGSNLQQLYANLTSWKFFSGDDSADIISMKLGMRLYDEFKDNENGLTYTVVLERLEGLTSVGESRLLHTCLDKSWEGITFV